MNENDFLAFFNDSNFNFKNIKYVSILKKPN